MSKKHNLIHEYKTILKRQTQFGKSKHKNKILAKEKSLKLNIKYQQPKGIYSTSTYNSYSDICRSFVIWNLKNHNNKIKNYMDCKKFATDWLTEKELSGLSAWSLHLYGSALASSFGGLSKSELNYTFPQRERKNIKRNRNDNLTKNYKSESQRNAITMLKATGCRRSEILRLRKQDFREQTNITGNKTGNLEVYKRGKGGIQRWCMVNPTYTNFVLDFIKDAKTYNYSSEARLFKKTDIPAEGIHSIRAIYAHNLYDYYEKEGFSTGDMYFCRKELAGVSYDKGILSKVSYDLQHSRNSIVIQYLWLTQ